jgi:hypothetical protein
MALPNKSVTDILARWGRWKRKENLDRTEPWSPLIFMEAYPSMLSIREGGESKILEGWHWLRQNRADKKRIK